MKVKFFWLALLASAALIGQTQAGTHHGSGGFIGGFSQARASSRAGSFYRPMGMRGYSGMAYPGRYSSLANRSMGLRQPYAYSGGRTFSGAQQFGNANTARFNQFGNNQRFAQGRNNFARANTGLSNQRFAQGQFRNGHNLAPNWHSHVIAQHSASWHHDWDHHHDHFFHGHRCCFINGSWFVFDLGFYPWWPYWWYPPYYGYGYPGYGYDYGNQYDYGYQNAPNPGYSYGNPNQQYYDENTDNQK